MQNLDDICQTGEPPWKPPSLLPTIYPRYHIARKGYQHCCKQTPGICISFSVNVDEWVTYIDWMTTVCQMPSCSVSGPRDTVRLAALRYVSRKSTRGAWNLQASTLVAENLSGWYHAVQGGVMNGEKKRNEQVGDQKKTQKPERRKQSQNFVPRSSFVCHTCRSDWHTKIVLLIKNRKIEVWRYHYLANINRCLLFTEIGHEISPFSENLIHSTACKSLNMNDNTLKLHYITPLFSLNSESGRFYKVIFVADLNWRQRDWDY